MKLKINITKREGKIIAIAIIAGLFFGWLFFHGTVKSGSDASKEINGHKHEEEKGTVWTCSMHPQIRMDKPGKCPICAMDLIPIEGSGGDEQAVSLDEIQMTEAAMKIADIQTMTVHKGYPGKEVYMLGKVKADERNISELTARFGGRIEKLYVNFTGQDVRKGEKLATIYSPALVTAQKELLEAIEYKQSNPEFYNAIRSKLKLWDLTAEQIDNIEKKGETQNYFDVLSPVSGTVTKRHVAHGDYLKEGSALFQVVDLNRVWILFEAYESDLPWIKTGDKVDFTVRPIPGKTFSSKAIFIDPVIDPQTRIARVRIEIDNRELLLKPEMFADGIIYSEIAGNRKDLLVPKTAILWTGRRAIVYVKIPDRRQPSFVYREIQLGPEAGEFYVVKAGLDEGEEIAVNGVFKIDATAQLAGKPSMMNPEGGKISTGHDHGGMDMGNGSGSVEGHSARQEMDQSKKETEISKKFRKQLIDVYAAYLEMKNAFVASDAKQAGQMADLVKNRLNAVNMGLLAGDAHMEWMQYLEHLNNALEKITGTTDIGEQRKAFAEYNLAFYKVMKNIGLSDGTVYYQYCPMADGDKGAYWFSNLKEIKNPYFGEAMLKCGETRETFNY
ncbi:MAG: efflux RND transporter periplasmic adaptor subunit [Bacteroidales bacterium]|nr:MAG: efflux RND transporter periplasmic adaptor subunit [Bacteroidales bacterium]